MIIKLTALLATAILLTACVSTHMKQYVGRDIREVMVDGGEPANVFDMGDGRRAFQFYWGGGTFAVPQTTTTTGSVVGNSVYLSSTTLPGGVVHSPGCLITYFARYDDGGDAWIVSDIAYPDRLVC